MPSLAVFRVISARFVRVNYTVAYAVHILVALVIYFLNDNLTYLHKYNAL